MRRPLFYSRAIPARPAHQRAGCSPACAAVRPSVCSTVPFSRFRNHSRFSGSRWVQQWLKKPRERAASPCPSGAFFRAGSYKTVRFFRKFLTCSGNLRNCRMVLRCGQTNLHKSGGALCTGCTKVFSGS